MGLRFAFAVNNDGVFEKKHFGEAEKFLIFKEINSKLILEKSIENTAHNIDEQQQHGSKKKAEIIINLLKLADVNVLVSMQFGKNIKIINNYFIPIIIHSDSVDSVIKIIGKQYHWISEEWEHKSSDYMLFSIKEGIMKHSLKN
jgi:predicted Fe-Mo cluster-binding NifX family protein